MENPRPEKVAVVEEVRERLASANASVVTEYRGLTVTQLAELRKNLAAIGDFKVYKNTLVRLAVAGSEYEELTELLSGPTAIAFVNGEISAAAKTLRDFARTYPALIVKGGLVGGSTLSTQDLTRLADLPSREVLLARFAGGLAAPLRQLAGLLQALPRNLAYGLSALVDQRRAEEPDQPVVPAVAPTAEAPASEAPTAEASATEAPTEAVEAEAAEAEAVEAEAVEAEAVEAEAAAPSEPVESSDGDQSLSDASSTEAAPEAPVAEASSPVDPEATSGEETAAEEPAADA
jgi:large subunit ribosomal protein L10